MEKPIHATTVNNLPAIVIVLSAERNKDWSMGIEKVFKVIQMFQLKVKATWNNQQSGQNLSESSEV